MRQVDRFRGKDGAVERRFLRDDASPLKIQIGSVPQGIKLVDPLVVFPSGSEDLVVNPAASRWDDLSGETDKRLAIAGGGGQYWYGGYTLDIGDEDDVPYIFINGNSGFITQFGLGAFARSSDDYFYSLQLYTASVNDWFLRRSDRLTRRAWDKYTLGLSGWPRGAKTVEMCASPECCVLGSKQSAWYGLIKVDNSGVVVKTKERPEDPAGRSLSIDDLCSDGSNIYALSQDLYAAYPGKYVSNVFSLETLEWVERIMWDAPSDWRPLNTPVMFDGCFYGKVTNSSGDYTRVQKYSTSSLLAEYVLPSEAGEIIGLAVNENGVLVISSGGYRLLTTGLILSDVLTYSEYERGAKRTGTMAVVA